MINVLIPTLGRPERLGTIVDNVFATSLPGTGVTFIVEADDPWSVDFAGQLSDQSHRVSVVVNERSKNYAGACNTAWHKFAPTTKYLFAGADDLQFTNGWDEVALAQFDGWFGVVGTNDNLNPYVLAGSHATHYMIDADYLRIYGGVVDEGPGSFLCEKYGHNYTDTEFIGTAKMRAKFRPCLQSVVRHMHWSAGLSTADGTTDKANASYVADSASHESRRDLWFNISR